MKRPLYVGAVADLLHDRSDCSLLVGDARTVSRKQVPGVAECPLCTARDAKRIFPARRHHGTCRICGRFSLMATFEHVPPQSALNDQTAIDHGPDRARWPEVPTAAPTRGTRMQRGVGGYTICDRCNHLTGAKYGAEYARWAWTAHAALTGVDLGALNSSSDHFMATLTLEDDAGVRPGLFVRQVLATMCSVSCGMLRVACPDVTSVILTGAPGTLPPSLQLLCCLMGTGTVHSTFFGDIADTVTNETALVAELVRYPFAFLVIFGDRLRPRIAGVDLTQMTELGADAPCESVRLEIPIGHRNTHLPGDYRSQQQVNESRSIWSPDSPAPVDVSPTA